MLYAFAQAVHYGVWLRLVPEDDRPRATPRSFRASYLALRDELGSLLLAAFALASVGLAIWAVADLVEARAGYLRFARFHGMLELTAIALWVTFSTPAATRTRPAASVRARFASHGPRARSK
jgi:hypothetical protein